MGNVLVFGLVAAQTVAVAVLLYRWRRWAGYAFGLVWTLIGLAENPGGEGVVWVGSLRGPHAGLVFATTALLVVAWETLLRSKRFGAWRDAVQAGTHGVEDPARVRRGATAWCLAGAVGAAFGLFSVAWIGRDASEKVTIAGGAVLGFGLMFLYAWSGRGATDLALRRRRAKWTILAVPGAIVVGLLFLWRALHPAP